MEKNNSKTINNIETIVGTYQKGRRLIMAGNAQENMEIGDRNALAIIRRCCDNALNEHENNAVNLTDMVRGQGIAGMASAVRMTLRRKGS